METKTARLLMTTILSETTGRSPDTVARLLDQILASHPSATIDAPIPDLEYAARLDALRKEKPGILNWLLAGARKAR